MRYSIISKGLSPAQIEIECKRVGASNITKTKLLGQVFCELDADRARALSSVSGLVVKPIKEYGTGQVETALPPVETFSDVFYLLRSYFNPPLTGTGLTVAVLDSGIRKSHQSLQNKVIYEANFTDSPSAEDIFGHGTQVAFVVAGGLHSLGEKAGVSPGASVMNIKVIGDEGIGSDESIILGIDRVCDLAESARKKGLWPTDDLYPNVIKLSLGGEDDGDEDNPVRAACRLAITDSGIDVIAAAGNTVPKMTSVLLPASAHRTNRFSLPCPSRNLNCAITLLSFICPPILAAICPMESLFPKMPIQIIRLRTIRPQNLPLPRCPFLFRETAPNCSLWLNYTSNSAICTAFNAAPLSS